MLSVAQLRKVLADDLVKAHLNCIEVKRNGKIIKRILPESGPCMLHGFMDCAECHQTRAIGVPDSVIEVSK